MSARFTRWAGALFLLALTGCTGYSIQPWFTERAQIFDRRLLGLWEGKSMIARVRANADSTAYTVSYLDKEEGVAVNGNARLARLGGRLFLDYAYEGEIRGQSWGGPLHQIYRVDLGTASLTLRAPDDDTLGVLLRAAMQEPDAQVSGIHVPGEGKVSMSAVLMVSPSTTLQDFLGAHADRKGLWQEVERLNRRR